MDDARVAKGAEAGATWQWVVTGREGYFGSSLMTVSVMQCDAVFHDYEGRV